MTAVSLAALEDLDRLVFLEELCEGDDAWSRGLVEEGVAGRLPTTRWLVTRHGIASGYAVVSLVDDVAELQRIGVDPCVRRQGVASDLLRAVRAAAAEHGAVRLLLEVREGNEPAYALYVREGFTEIARRPKYYRDGSTAIVMEVAP